MATISSSSTILKNFLKGIHRDNTKFYTVKFSPSEVERAISDLTGNITQLNSNHICVSKLEDGYLLSHVRNRYWSKHDEFYGGVNVKFLETKEQLINFIKNDTELYMTVESLYPDTSTQRKIKALMVNNAENFTEPKKNNGITKTLGNKVKELRSVYLQKENINKPII